MSCHSMIIYSRVKKMELYKGWDVFIKTVQEAGGAIKPSSVSHQTSSLHLAG